MKRYLALLLAALLLLSLTAGCGSGSRQEEPGKIYHIGLVTGLAGLEDKGLNQAAWAGLQALQNTDSRFQIRCLEPDSRSDYPTLMDTLREGGCHLIVCAGSELSGALAAEAAAHPEQLFVLLDDDTVDLPNVACLTFSPSQQGYLAGLVAGLMTQSGRVGYVQSGTSDKLEQYAVGYIAGVKKTNAKALILQETARSAGSKTAGAAAAVDMITNGVDVICHAPGTSGEGVIQACKEHGIRAIGVDHDQSHLAPGTVITSSIKRVDTALREMAEQVADGKFRAGIHLYDLTNQGLDILEEQQMLPAEVVTKVNQIMSAAAAGELTIPTDPAQLEELYPGVFQPNN